MPISGSVHTASLSPVSYPFYSPPQAIQCLTPFVATGILLSSQAETALPLLWSPEYRRTGLPAHFLASHAALARKASLKEGTANVGVLLALQEIPFTPPRMTFSNLNRLAGEHILYFGCEPLEPEEIAHQERLREQAAQERLLAWTRAFLSLIASALADTAQSMEGQTSLIGLLTQGRRLGATLANMRAGRDSRFPVSLRPPQEEVARIHSALTAQSRNTALSETLRERLSTTLQALRKAQEPPVAPLAWERGRALLSAPLLVWRPRVESRPLPPPTLKKQGTTSVALLAHPSLAAISPAVHLPYPGPSSRQSALRTMTWIPLPVASPLLLPLNRKRPLGMSSAVRVQIRPSRLTPVHQPLPFPPSSLSPGIVRNPAPPSSPPPHPGRSRGPEHRLRTLWPPTPNVHENKIKASAITSAFWQSLEKARTSTVYHRPPSPIHLTKPAAELPSSALPPPLTSQPPSYAAAARIAASSPRNDETKRTGLSLLTVSLFSIASHIPAFLPARPIVHENPRPTQVPLPPYASLIPIFALRHTVEGRPSSPAASSFHALPPISTTQERVHPLRLPQSSNDTSSGTPEMIAPPARDASVSNPVTKPPLLSVNFSPLVHLAAPFPLDTTGTAPKNPAQPQKTTLSAFAVQRVGDAMAPRENPWQSSVPKAPSPAETHAGKRNFPDFYPVALQAFRNNEAETKTPIVMPAPLPVPPDSPAVTADTGAKRMESSKNQPSMAPIPGVAPTQLPAIPPPHNGQMESLKALLAHVEREAGAAEEGQTRSSSTLPVPGAGESKDFRPPDALALSSARTLPEGSGAPTHASIHVKTADGKNIGVEIVSRGIKVEILTPSQLLERLETEASKKPPPAPRFCRKTGAMGCCCGN